MLKIVRSFQNEIENPFFLNIRNEMHTNIGLREEINFIELLEVSLPV